MNAPTTDADASQTKRILVIGTCRVYRSAFKMERDNVVVSRVPHRFHTLKHTELALRYHDGADVFPRDLTHTISRRTGEILVREDRPFETIEALRRGLPPIDSFDAYVIEISSLKEHYATTEQGREFLVNSLVHHDMKRLSDRLEPFYESGALQRLSAYRSVLSSTEEVKAAMRCIKNLLKGKPILWVPQANVPSPRPAEQAVVYARARLAVLLQTGATRMADTFYDPTELATKMGRAAFFKDNGRDLQHYTPHAQKALADILLSLVAPDARGPEPTGEMQDDEEDVAT